MMNSKAESIRPPLQPLFPPLVEHSTSSCSDNVISSPVTSLLMLSTVLTAEKAQQLPACHHSITTNYKRRVLTCMRVATLIILFKDNIHKLWFAVKYCVCLSFSLSVWGNFTGNHSYFSSCKWKISYKVSTGQNRRRAKTNFPTMVKQKRLGVVQHLINVSLEKEFS